LEGSQKGTKFIEICHVLSRRFFFSFDQNDPRTTHLAGLFNAMCFSPGAAISIHPLADETCADSVFSTWQDFAASIGSQAGLANAGMTSSSIPAHRSRD
jgi:hypothetical protein